MEDKKRKISHQSNTGLSISFTIFITELAVLMTNGSCCSALC